MFEYVDTNSVNMIVPSFLGIHYFVSWSADQAGLIDAGVIPRFEGCSWGVDWFQNNAAWMDHDYEPSSGDIFFDWDQDGIPDHVGIVEKFENNIIYTIEGNSNDACVQNRYYVVLAPGRNDHFGLN